jgi:uncharacterized repeat protein (TIGR01451 family)
MNSLLRNHQLKHSQKLLKKTLILTAVFSLAIAALTSNAIADITNSAVAEGTYNASIIYSLPSAAAVPVVTAAPSLFVTKSASPSSAVTAGQVVTYTYTAKNTGNVTVMAISLVDVHNAAGVAPVPGSEVLSNDASPANDSTDLSNTDGIWDALAPGDTISFTATYTVKQIDVDTLQ